MVKVLDINIFDKKIDDAVKIVIDTCLSSNNMCNHCVSATGAHGIIYASKNPNFKILLNSFFLNLPDGMANVWVGKLKGAKKMQRCPGPDFFASLMQKSADKPIKHFFCGGKEGVAADLKISSENKFGNFNVVGVYSPPFREMTDSEMADLGRNIVNSQADIVWIGLSTPKQEQFAIRLKRYTSTKFIITVGAAYDFHTGRLKKAPVFMQQSGLEWFYRLLMEPRRLFKRYFEIVPLFIGLNLKELLIKNKTIKSKLN